MNKAELYARKRNIVAQMRDLSDRLEKDGKFDPETEQQFDGLDDELQNIEDNIKRAERLEAIETQEDETRDFIKDTKPAKKSEEQILDEKKQVLSDWLFRGRRSNEDYLGGLGLETRAQSTTTTAGGYTIAEDFSKAIETHLKYYGPFANKAASGLIMSANGAAMPYPTNDDTSNTGALLAEAGDSSSSVTDLTFGVVTFADYKYTSKLIQVSKELEQDSYFNIVNYVAEALATRLGRALNTAFTTGTGSSQPQGVVTGGSQGKVTASATAITFSELIDLKHSVDISYRNRPLSGWMMNDAILAYLKKVSIALTTQTIWQPSLVAGTPDLIDGEKFWVNNDMASAVTTGQKTLLYGDFSNFVVRWIGPTRAITLAERYAEKDLIGVVGFQRVDSHVINSSAIKYLEQT